MQVRVTRLCTALIVAVLIAPAVIAGPVVFDFEDAASPLNETWEPCALDAGSSVAIATENAAGGSRSLKVSGKLPAGFGVQYVPWRDWTGYTTLAFDLWVPASVPKSKEGFDCWVYIKDASYYWFQTPVYADPVTLKPKVPVARGKWAHIELDISEDSTIWRPGGHKRSWDHVTYKPREFGIRFFGKDKWEGSVLIDNVTLKGSEPPLGKTGSASGARVTKSLAPVASSQWVPKYEKFELTFKLAETYENPYDPAVVNVEGHFAAADGKVVTVPGFYFQDYERSLSDEGFEQLVPIGEPCWKVRFAPREIGQYRYWITVKDAAGTIESRPETFLCTVPREPRGYVRVSKVDPLYFEFENGEWFWPIGINMRDGGDDASKQKGTYDFDHYFKRFHDEGINLVRTWMCAWWGGIEWSDEYHSRFLDEGRYNMYNAWRMDYCVDLARRYDLLLEITFNSHGQVRRDKFDEEWTYSPWNTRNGGHVASPAMFFSDDGVKQAFRNRYRYIVARWGYSRNIMSWDLWNEVDLVEGYDPQTVSNWHREMGAYLKSIDPWKHLVVTHICLFWSFGNEMWQTPEIEFVQSDAYWDQNDKRRGDFRTDMGMYASYTGKTNPGDGYAPLFKKPFVFIEYGPLYTSVAAGKVPPDDWQRRFRIGMWTAAVLPNGAAPVFWYHKEWDDLGLYKFQKPLQKLFSHYDRRGRDFRMRSSGPSTQNIALIRGGELKAIGMLNAREGYFYIHDPAKVGLPREELTSPVEGASAAVHYVQPGQYKIDFIDTITAEEIGQAEAVADDQTKRLQIDLPPIADDLLVRITRR